MPPVSIGLPSARTAQRQQLAVEQLGEMEVGFAAGQGLKRRQRIAGAAGAQLLDGSRELLFRIGCRRRRAGKPASSATHASRRAQTTPINRVRAGSARILTSDFPTARGIRQAIRN